MFELEKRNFEYWSGPMLSYSTLQGNVPIWGICVLENKNPLTVSCKKVISIEEPKALRKKTLKHSFLGFYNIVIWLLCLFPIIFMK